MNTEHLYFKEYLESSGLKASNHVVVHASFKKIKSAFHQITPDETINALKKIVTPLGSVIFPAFTYCFKKSTGDYERFDRDNSKSKVGLLSETFRLSDNVIRTSSPTHSFSLWGKIINDIDATNSPQSPLGEETVLEWLTTNSNSYVLMLGTDFSSLTYGHYLEIQAKVPWFDFAPWDYLNVLPIGVSVNGEQKLKVIPGCAKSFVKFEKYLLENNLIEKMTYNTLESYRIPIELLYKEGIEYFLNNFESLLCSKGNCQACDSRRTKFLQ